MLELSEIGLGFFLSSLEDQLSESEIGPPLGRGVTGKASGAGGHYSVCITVNVSEVEIPSYPHCMDIVLSSSDAFYCFSEVFHIFIISPVWSVEGANYEVYLVFELDSDKY